METDENINNKMTVKGIIWNVVNGEVKEIKINNDIYIKKYSQEIITDTTKKDDKVIDKICSDEIKKDEEKDKPVKKELETRTYKLKKEETYGDRICAVGSASIYSNVLNDLIEGVKQNKTQDELKEIIGRYYDNVEPETLSTYLSAYKRYIREKYPELKDKVPYRLNGTIQSHIEKGKDKGQKIMKLGHNTVYSNILSDIKNAYKNNATETDLIDIIREYYPTTKKLSSLRTYLAIYRRYLMTVKFLKKTSERGGYFLNEDYNENYEKEILKTEKKELPKELQKRTFKRRKRAGAVGLDKTYNMWIHEDDIKQIKNAINTVEYGYKPTSNNIKEKTDLNMQKIRATLHWMAEKKMVTWYFEDDIGPIYKLL